MAQKALLMILDGWGIGNKSKSDVIFSTPTPNLDKIVAQYPHSELLTSGESVGLPEGQMGNSEVGHLNIGAGRIVYQDLVKINIACRDNSILNNEEVVKAYSYAKENGKQIHLLGLVSEGGVHSSLDHLFKLTDISKQYGIDKTFVHCFMDGRDTDPKSGKGYVQQLVDHIKTSTGSIASVTGRFYGMDRDKRWERVKVCYDAMVNGVGTPVTDVVAAIQASYDAGITDEFIKPIIQVDAQGKPVGSIQEGDVVIFFNFRNDRAKELTIVLTQDELLQKARQATDMSPEAAKALNEMTTLPLYYCTITPYDDKFKGLHILFDKDNVSETIGEVIANAGLKQLRIAETEKYAHVTFFFSGGREQEFAGEKRILIPSPKVATYDLQPEMSAPAVADAVVEEINAQSVDFIALNFANGDMVGHTGIYSAIQTAIKTVDDCVGKVVDAAKANGYTVMIIADHGNADYAINDDGSFNTAHSTNPVPCILVTDEYKSVKNGVLADVAPTILKIMGVNIPQAMTGNILV